MAVLNQVLAGLRGAPAFVVGISQLTGEEAVRTLNGGVDAWAGLTLFPSGEVFKEVSPSQTWGTPVGGTPGNSFWARATLEGGSDLNAGVGTGTWNQLNHSRFFGIHQPHTVAGTRTSTIRIDIASDSAGANIVATRSNITLTASVI